MSNTTTNPLVAPILEAQEIVRQSLSGDFSDYAGMQRLARLLCGPEMHLKLIEAGALSHLHGAAANEAAA